MDEDNQLPYMEPVFHNLHGAKQMDYQKEQLSILNGGI